MSKAILVMDKMPLSCNVCRLRAWDANIGDYCIAGTPRRVHSCMDEGVRADWCPLVPMPEHQPELHDSSEGDYGMGWNEGWNTCLDEIEGGNDNG